MLDRAEAREDIASVVAIWVSIWHDGRIN